MDYLKIYPKGPKFNVSYKLTSKEFACRCTYNDCIFTLVSTDLESSWTRVRASFGKSLKVNSGFRCQRHNKDVGGEDKSKHKEGKAIDIDKTKLKPLEKTLLVALCREHFEIVLDYGNFLHCHNN